MNTKCFRACKIIVLVILFSVLTLANSIFAFSGWTKDGDHVVYVNQAGYRIANAWREDRGNKFYLDENGYVVYDKVFEYGDKIYYVEKSGARVTNSFVYVTKDMILGDSIEPGLFYFGSDGAAYERTSNNFIRTIDGKKFAFDDFAHVMTDSWISNDGDYLSADDDVISDGWYYANENGALLQNSWYEFTYDAASDRELGSSNFIADDYNDIDKLWMYFGNDCKKLVGSDTSTKKLRLNGYEYAFDSRGILLLGFQKNQADVDYNQRSNPTVAEKIKYYDPYAGDLTKNKWIYTTTPKSFSEEDYNDGKHYWFYVGNDGSLIKNRIRTIENKKYIFDGFGRVKDGFIISDGVGYYVADYKAEDLNKDDFVFSVDEGSKLYGTDLADLFYFSEKEDTSEGFSMQTGLTKLELNDGVYEFYFRSNGRAMGQKSTLTLYKNSYYKNGLKYIPWEDTKYGIVKVSDTEYRVINSNGKVINAKRKLIKDDYGNSIVILNNVLAAYIKEPLRRTQYKWETRNGITGYHKYDRDTEKKTYAGVAVASGTMYPTAAQIADIPKDLRVNFK